VSCNPSLKGSPLLRWWQGPEGLISDGRFGARKSGRRFKHQHRAAMRSPSRDAAVLNARLRLDAQSTPLAQRTKYKQCAGVCRKTFHSLKYVARFPELGCGKRGRPGRKSLRNLQFSASAAGDSVGTSDCPAREKSDCDRFANRAGSTTAPYRPMIANPSSLNRHRTGLLNRAAHADSFLRRAWFWNGTPVSRWHTHLIA